MKRSNSFDVHLFREPERRSPARRGLGDGNAPGRKPALRSRFTVSRWDSQVLQAFHKLTCRSGELAFAANFTDTRQSAVPVEGRLGWVVQFSILGRVGR
jgi:hypothetical protein